MCDKLVFDLSQEVEGSPNVFIRKDWINILDNQNQNYQNNQSIIDTSQLSNSNKYMGYREAYLAVPLTLTMTTPAVGISVLQPTNLNEGVALNSQMQVQGVSDYAIGLKNWYGSIIHSFTLDYNGTTIIQQTPFCNMWNTFKLLTTLSYSDIVTQGPTIGFYPDTASSWRYQNQSYTTFNLLNPVNSNLPAAVSLQPNSDGIYTCNNDLAVLHSSVSSCISSSGNRLNLSLISQGEGNLSNDVQIGGNYGATIRTSWINYNPKVQLGSQVTYSQCGVTSGSCDQIWKSYIYKQVNSTNGTSGVQQIAVMATIYLKHVHSFFNMIPLLKGVFMKMTMNLNNASSTISIAGDASPGTSFTANPAANAVPGTGLSVTGYSSTVPVGGVNPLLIPGAFTGSRYVWGGNQGDTTVPPNGFVIGSQNPGNYWYNLSVGAKILGINPNNVLAEAFSDNPLAKSIYLYVPAYTFNPVFEEAYLSNPVKQIKYTDIYQYQVQNVTGGGQGQFNNLITNGIANIKSVLIIPFYSYGTNSQTVNGVQTSQPTPVYQSPFDTAGCGTTSPMVTLGNFNVQISGQNAIYNTQRYTFEEFNNQLYGQFAVNGGLTDGLTSGLIGFEDFKQSYCYYYVNVERMLPVEQSVPKSVQIIGTNYSTQKIDMWVFIEYGVEINIDLTTGARV
jgi:hypothetical protein